MTDNSMLRYPGIFARTQASKPAVVMAETGATLTYAELDAYANRLARLYRSLGLRPGAHVAYCVENRVECLAINWGAHYAGLYYTFISSRLTGREAAYIAENCEAGVLVLSRKTAPAILDSIRNLRSPPQIFSLDELGDVALLSDALNGFDSSSLDDALEGSEMLYSSGTTGMPKGIKPTLTGKPLGTTHLMADLMSRGFNTTADSVYLSPAPYYHSAPLKWSQGVSCLGATFVMMERFDAESALRAIERYKVTHSQWVPTMFHRLLALPEEVKRRYDLSSLVMAVHAAAPCPAPTKLAMIDWWGPVIYEYYSCTESIGMTYTDTAAWLSHPGTVGRPLLGALHIMGEDGHEVAAGEEGLVYFADGPAFSYHKEPAKTAEAHNAAGWATVGDIGRLDADGFLYLTDRKSNMIISGGVNVYPQEAENVLITHPKIFDVAVIGVPHEDLGEQVRAIVQLEPDFSPSAALAEELIKHCRAELSSIKCPLAVDFRESLPREPNGKLLKRLLRDEYRARHMAGERF